MITLEELQNKELDALIPLAKELGVKKPASDKEDLIYQMLDAQAENFASNAPQREPRERRGRKSPQPTDADDSQPKKRGRKPKTAEAVVPTEQPADDAQPKKRGRKPKKDAESVDETLSDANTSGQNISEDNTNAADSLRINELLRALWAKCGVTLVDFKIEFGRTSDGEIILADEISPDTCRLWDSETKKKLDKDRFRRDLGGVEDAYTEIMGRLNTLIGENAE